MIKRGYTFIELIIALSLFLVGMLSILQLFPANRRLLAQSGMRTQAAFLAQEQLETARGNSYANLTVGTYRSRAAISNDTSSVYSLFERQVVVELIDANRAVTNTDVGLKRVTATIYWSERTLSQQYSVSTIVNR